MTTPQMPVTPHLAVPFRVEHGRAVTVEEDTLDEVKQNVIVVLDSRQGERLMVPTFGLEDPTFRLAQEAIDETEILSAVEDFEPRAVLDFSDAYLTDDGEITGSIIVGIQEVD